MPARCFRSPLLLFLIISLMSSCSFDFGNVPEGAQITCKTSADCPTGWVCSDTVLICVKPEDMKNRPQLVGSPFPSPALLKKAAVSVLSFEVSKELAEDPTVVVDVGGVKKTFLKDKSQSSGLKYVYTYQAAGDETQNAPWSVTVDLKDKVGNVASGLPAGSLTFDFIAPKIESALLVGSPVKNGGVVRAVLTLDKAVEKDPVLKLDNSKVFGKESSSGGVNFTYTYVAAGDDGVEGGQTERVVTIEVSDEAGNQTIETIKDKVTFDYQKPELIGDVTITPMYVAELGAVTVLFESNKELGPVPEVKLGSVSMSLSVRDGKKYTYTHIAETADGEGLKPLSIKLVDKAGNETTTDTKKDVGFMFTKPVVSNVAANSAKFSKQAGFKDLAVTFDCPKDVGAGLVVTVGNEPMTCLVWQPTSPNYTCTFDVSQTAQTGGYKVISITTLDPAGNSGEGSVGVEFDFAVPVLTLSISPEGRDARLGEKLTVSVASSKALVSPGVVLGTAGLDLGTPGIEGNIYTWVKEIKSGETGKYAITADGKDDVGNPGVQRSGNCGLDGVVPEIKDGVLNPPRIKGGGTLTSTFKVNKTVKPNPSVTASNSKDTPVSMDFDSYDPDQKLYTYKKAMPDSGTSPFYSVTVYAEDAAGNQVTSTLGTVEVDNTPPELAGFDLSPAEAKLGTIVRVIITGSEIIEGAPILKAVKDGDPTKELVFNTTDIKGLSFSYQAEIKANTSDGTYRFQPFELKDEAGNKETRNPADKFKADFRVEASQPTVSNITLNKTRFSRQDGFKEIILNFDCPKDVGTGLDVKIGGDKVTCDPWKNTSPNYNCTYDVSKTALAEGSQIISIVTHDAAGNTSSGSKTVEFDFTAPELTLSIIPSDRPAKLGEELKITVSSNKKLGGSGVLLGTGGLTMDSKSVSGNTYSWTRATQSADQGTYAVTADATDEVGNPATRKTGLAKLDGVVPTVGNLNVTGGDGNKTFSRVDSYNKINLSFTCEKDVKASGALSAKLDTESITNCVYTSGTKTYSCSYPIPASGGLSAGSHTINVTATDTAGNTDSKSTPVTFDFTGPQITAKPSKPQYKLNETINYTVTLDEPITGTPTVKVFKGLFEQVGFFGTPTKNSDTSFTFSGTAASTYDGDFNVTVDATDILGNPTIGTVGDGYKLNTTVPRITAGPTVEKDYCTIGDKVAVIFTSTEAIDLALSKVMLDTVPPRNMPCTSGANFAYKCSLPTALIGMEIPQGLVGISIELSDSAGNISFGSATVVLDFIKPDVLSATPGKPRYKKDETVYYTVNVSEALGTTGTPPKEKIVVNVFKNGSTTPDPNFFGDPTIKTDTSFTYVTTASAGKNGEYTVKIDLVDKAGNDKKDQAGTSFTLDFGPPEITLVAIETSNIYQDPVDPIKRAKASDVITATFTVDKILQGNPLVTIGGNGMLYDSVNGTGPYTYKYKYTVVGIEDDGVKTVSVTATDEAGNITVKDIGYATFDFTPPDYQTGTSTVQLISDFPNNPVVAVTSVKNDTTVFVTFSITEDLYTNTGDPSKNSPDPKVVACITSPCDPTNIAQVIKLDKDAQSSGGNFYKFSKKIIGLTPDVTFVSNIYMIPDDTGPMFDKAGNTQNNVINIAQFNVNTKKPSTPPVTNVYYRRVPWGQNDASGKFVEKNFTVVCNACQFSSDTKMVLIYDSATTSSGGLIGSYTNPGTGNAWSFDKITLNGSDRAHVYLATADSAGNISPATEIKSAEWVATMGYKVPGSTLENPHTFTSAGIFENKPVQTQFISESDVSWRSLTAPVVQIGRHHEWEYLDTANLQIPAGRTNQSMAYDSMRGQIVMFGGSAETVGLNDTWMLESTKWIQKSPATAPTSRENHAMTYDSARGQIVIFGGRNGVTTLNDTWLWDGNNWIYKSTPTTPTNRAGHAMAFDAANGNIVMFGGRDGTTYLTDTWVWDGSNWLQKSPATVPQGRADHAMAFDATNGNIVMFGGNDGSTNLNDTWIWNGNNWIQNSPAFKPPSRSGHAMAFDIANNYIAIFGGADSSGYLNDMWIWNGSDWQHKTVTNMPPARQGHSLSYDSSQNRMILFGGSGLNDTWFWNGKNWSWSNAQVAPPANSAFGMAYDEANDKTVMFGGWNYTQGFPNDTWVWDGSKWSKNTSFSPSPEGRGGNAMVYDSNRGKIVMFGGSGSGPYYNDIWEWDGAINSWEKKQSGGLYPSARYSHALAYDKTRGKIVLFGGSNGTSCLNDTWEWDGSINTWTKRIPTGVSPNARFNHAMAYDSSRGRVVLFGGIDSNYSYFNDTWEWDGNLNTWSKITPSGAIPGARSSHAIIYDSIRNKVVMFGGNIAAGGGTNDTWEWDGLSWIQRTTVANPPPVRGAHGMAYDVNRGNIILFGGYGSSDTLNDTWVWDGTYWTPSNMQNVFPDRTDKAAVFDKFNNQTILFGGWGSHGYTSFNDTWKFNGTVWQKLSPGGLIPSRRHGHAMAYDIKRKKIIMFGGNDNGTYEYDVITNTWLQVVPAGVSPIIRNGHTMAYDIVRDRTLLFGGDNLTDTWEWDGTAWVQKYPASSPSSGTGLMVYDNYKGTVIYVMNGASNIETWEWDGNNWAQKLVATRPTKRSGFGITYDYHRGKVMLFGGAEGNNYLNDTWELNGNDWKKISFTTNPPPQIFQALVYDSENNTITMMGGIDSTAYLNDTWILSLAGDRYPGEVLSVSAMAIGAINSTGTNLGINPVSLNAKFISGGIGYPNGVETVGVNLMTWYDNTWHAVNSNNSGPKTPGLVEWTTTDEGKIKKLLYSGGMNFNFAVVPRAPNGFGHPNCPYGWTAEECDMGMVSTQYAEITLKYTLP